jgi:hypothetical protein
MSTSELKKECHNGDVSMCTTHLQVQGEEKNTPNLVDSTVLFHSNDQSARRPVLS